MPKKTYIATAPDGSEHKRTSESRTYTHAVIGRRSHAAQLASANSKSTQVQDGENWDYYMECAAGLHEHATSKWTTEKERATWAGFAAANPDRAAYVRGMHEHRIASVEERKAAGYYDAWHAITWCGRPDLAGKQIAANATYWVDLQAVPAVLKGAR